MDVANINVVKLKNIVAGVVFLVIGVPFLILLSHSGSQKPVDRDVAVNPKVSHAELGPGETLQDYTMFKLPLGLEKAQIHDIVFHDTATWLGTDKGLVKIVGQEITQYQQFADWPFEWVKHLVLVPDGIAAIVYVANGNTGGTPAGSYFFSFETESWHKIGANSLAQAWLDGYLYQANSRLIRRSPGNQWKEEQVLESVCGKTASSLKMRAIEGEIWITGIGQTLQINAGGSIGCGVLRYNPKDGSNTHYSTSQGLNHDSGWDLDGDEQGIYLTHSVKNNYLSQFDYAQQRWSSMFNPGSGNHIAVTKERIWLASAFASKPFIVFDRENYQSRSLPEISNKEYVSTLAINEKKLWFGTYIKDWTGSNYTIRSRLGRFDIKQQ